jgi:hypothetical protein
MTRVRLASEPHRSAGVDRERVGAQRAEAVVARYHFKLTNETETFEDPAGVDLANLTDAREEAIMCARELMRTPGKRYCGDWSAWSVRVLDDVGGEVYALRLCEVAPPP